MKKLGPNAGYLFVYGLQTAMIHLLGPYLVLWMEASGLSFTEIGLAMSAYQALALVLDFPTGGLADKYGRRLNFAFGMFLCGAGYVVVALSRSMAGFVTGFALAGTGAAFTSGSLTAWVYDATGDRRAAYETFSKITIVEGLVGPVSAVVASAVSAAGLNLPIASAGTAGLTASFAAVALLEENYGKEPERSYVRVLSEGVAETLGNKPLLYLVASGCLMSFVATSFMIYWVIVLRGRGLPEAWSGTVYALLILSMALGGVVSRRLSRAADFRKVALLSTCAWGVLFLTISCARSLVLATILFVAVEVVYAIRSAAILTFENDLTLQRNRAAVLSFVGTILSATGLVAAPLAGRVADVWGVTSLYKLSSFLAFCAAVCVFGAVRSGVSSGARD